MAPTLSIINLLLTSFIFCVHTYMTEAEWSPINEQTMEMDLLDSSVLYGSNRSQYGRIFQFNQEGSKIRVELGFAIPFLTIPVNTKPKNGNSAENYLVDINLGALAAGGILSVASLIFIPTYFNGLDPTLSYGRNDNGDKSGFSGLLSRVDDTLMDYNIDSSTCTQRAVCWFINSAVNKVNSGNGGSMDKIVDGFASNSWLENIIKGTAIQEAINNGRKGKNCSAMYSKCPITQEQLRKAAIKIVSEIKS